MKRLLSTALLLVALGIWPQFVRASATSIYISQNGTSAGNCTTNVQTPAFFNNAANWGTGAGQIGPGTTVLICGTLTFPTNSSGLIVQGSGSNGNPITIKFDNGAVLQSNAFSGNFTGGGIVINSQSYVIVDGQKTGTIRNLANGSPGQTTCISGSCSVQQSSLGIYVHKTAGVEIKNLTIKNIYMDLDGEQSGGGSGAAWETADIYTDGPNTNLNVDGNTLNDAHVGIWSSFDNGSTSANFYSNTISHHAWQISAANGSSCSNTGIFNIYANDISNWNDWNQGGASSFHTDGIIEYTRSTGCTAPKFNPVIYNNYFHGDLDGGTGSGTAHIYCSNDVGGNTSFANSTCTVFNNVIDMSSSSNCAAAIWDAGRNAVFYNNTIIGPSSCTRGASVGVAFGANAAGTLENNIFSTLRSVYMDPGPYGSLSTEIAVSNYNDVHNCIGSSACFAFGQGNWSTLSSWTSSSGLDANSSTSDPLLTSGYALGSSSPVSGFGVNLDSALSLGPCCSSLTLENANIGIGALAYDKILSERPSAGKWDIGAMQGVSVTVAAPTSLTAQVQ